MDATKEVERYIDLVTDLVKIMADERGNEDLVREVENAIHLMRTVLKYPI